MSETIADFYEAYSPDRQPEASDRVVIAGPLRDEYDPMFEGTTHALRRDRVAGMLGSVLGLVPGRENVYYVWHHAQWTEQQGRLVQMGPGMKAYTGDELLRINLGDEA